MVFEEDFKLFSHFRELILSRKENLDLPFAVTVLNQLTLLTYIILNYDQIYYFVISLPVTIMKR